MRENKIIWATDTIVSRPEAPKADVPVLKDFGGFGFTMHGMVHNISESEIEAMVTPTFAPEGYRGRLEEDIFGGPEDG